MDRWSSVTAHKLDKKQQVRMASRRGKEGKLGDEGGERTGARAGDGRNNGVHGSVGGTHQENGASINGEAKQQQL